MTPIDFLNHWHGLSIRKIEESMRYDLQEKVYMETRGRFALMENVIDQVYAKMPTKHSLRGL